MIQYELLKKVIECLEKAEIDYMVAGSTASSLYGEPRMTRDIDVVVNPTPETIEVFVAVLSGAELYVGDAVAAVAHQTMFNILDNASGWKIDLIIRKDRLFSETEFSRRQPVNFAGEKIFFATLEDTILAKLEWGQRSGSERQMGDVVAMLKANQKSVDHQYLDYWADNLGVTQALAEARQTVS
ncbi:MAG: hypothetical protein OSA06_05465 [Acidimicrobiales bacterium]|nr:hypothetical protein [Acidimicrobiales bacterium]